MNKETRLPSKLEAGLHKIKTIIGNQVMAEQAMWRKGIGETSRTLGLVDLPRINIPKENIGISIERGIIEKEPYYTNAEGKTVYENGSPILERYNPERTAKEHRRIREYISEQKISEQEFIHDVLNDPNSDTKIDLDKAGVKKINIRRFKPMTTECRAAIIVPARFEERRIKEMLDGYAKQKNAGPNQFEINVIVNHRIDETPDQTSEVVLKFMREHPELHVNLLDAQLDNEHARVGWARKLITDLVLARSIQRKDYFSPIYIITEDADVTKVDPKIVNRVINKFDLNAPLDCLRGRQDRSNALISQNDLCALTYKANQIAETILRDKKLRNPYRSGYNFDWNRVVSGGWASAFTAEAYALFGGYIGEATVGEDVAIGQLCSIMRGHWDEAGNIVPFMEISATMPVKGESNFIRMGNEILTQLSAYDLSQFENQDIKRKNELDILQGLREYRHINPNDEKNIKRFEGAVKGAFNFIKGCVGDNSLLKEHYVPFYLLMLGFRKTDYQIVNTNGDIDLIINNWSNLIRHLDKNRRKYEKEFHEKYI
jgi:hypothetical protein